MASKKKNLITKDDLKRLMRENKSSSASLSKKIDHPMAKYNSLDQLVCVMCNKVVKTNALWVPHLQSRLHKETMENFKKAIPSVCGGKRKITDIDHLQIQNKKLKGTEKEDKSSQNKSLPGDFFDKNMDGAASVNKPNALANYSSSEESSNEDVPETKNMQNSSSVSSVSAAVSGLPSDFFDTGVAPSEMKEEKPQNTMSSMLPEGFFDDPKLDAKVRQVEYKDKMEEEWELFQRAMKEENQISEVIFEEEDEQVNVDRNIDEIDDQFNRWKEINDLEKKKATISFKEEQQETKNDSDDDLEELENFMDWRSKKTWK